MSSQTEDYTRALISMTTVMHERETEVGSILSG